MTPQEEYNMVWHVYSSIEYKKAANTMYIARVINPRTEYCEEMMIRLLKEILKLYE